VSPIPSPTRVLTRNRLILIGLWFVFYASFALFTPALLDDADSVHAEVAREMLLRHDWTTLYANGIRYLEKAPLLYWSMAASMKLFGAHTFAARLPLAFTVLALALAMDSFARRAFRCTDAGLYASVILLSSFGIFVFTRITIPDAMVCLWLTLAIFCYWLTDSQTEPKPLLCYAFAACCALNVLTKGLIGIVFPIAIVISHLLFTRGPRATLQRLRQFHPITSFLTFLTLAAPWHILIGLANPTQGHPGSLSFPHRHWIVAEPTQNNVHGWLWFYFVNEHLLRYLNLRVPRDYDTVSLALFWGLLLVWLMPWSAFLYNALGQIPWSTAIIHFRQRNQTETLLPTQSTLLLLGIWAAVPMLFFSLSTRQEYYVLPSLPALILLIAAWLTREAAEARTNPNSLVAAGQRISVVILVLGFVAAFAVGFLILHTQLPSPNTDLSTLLKQNPGDYALSFGHFLDLNVQAMGAFRTPLLITAFAFFTGPLANWQLRRIRRPHAANICLAAATFAFLVATHLGLQIFSPVLTSKELANAIAIELKPEDVIVIHGEYESASTLGFYLHRNDLHILEGRSSNLWYGSFFADAPPIFEDAGSLSTKWAGPQRLFLWTEPQHVPILPGKVYLIAQSGGKEILSNQPSFH
jgi:4-amino-4-deoxy-L-arabinose transferase-like glycosyltransferase